MIELAGVFHLPPPIMMDMTVREIDAYASGADRRARAAQALALTTAWETANFMRAKRLPNIRGRLRQIMRGDGPQSASEMRSVIDRMRASARQQGLGPPRALKAAQDKRK